MHEQHTETVAAIARAGGVSERTVRFYADAGFVEFIRTSDGRRLFQPSAGERVREVHARRLANRGHGRRQA
jgi:DNA-binding transcriptional MerR regulator